MPEPLTAGVLFAGSLVVLLVRPRRVPDWAAALGGGLLMVAIGIWTPQQAAGQLAESGDVLLFFLGLGVASATADRAGLFEAAARFAAAGARGSQQRLLISVFVVGAVLTAVLSNDATALLLTPVAFASATRLGLNPRPYVFACALVANAASFLLPVSNPANLLILTHAPLSLSAFLTRLLVPSLLALCATLLGLLVVFRDDLRAPYAELPMSGPALTSRTRASLVGVSALGALYVLAAAFGWPLGRVAVTGAFLSVVIDSLVAGWDLRGLARQVPWSVLGLVAGLLLLVGGAEQANLFEPLVRAIETASTHGANGLPGLVVTTAILANVINNLPGALVAATALSNLSSGVDRGNLVAAVIVGVNLGPNLTTIGSLATMLWLLLLRRRGLQVSALEYVRVGGVVTVPALALAAAALWVIGGVLSRGL
ncbi:MAG: arsenic transporter [Chloroflexi bacterium]|nr:arsenic transporter [Chloroflexota bacterium]